MIDLPNEPKVHEQTLLCEDSRRDAAASLLKVLIPRVMQSWEVAVRLEVGAAAHQERLTLYDDVPALLAEVAQALAIGREELCEESDASKAHAKHRARTTEYSLNEVVQEYHVLRRVLIAELQSVLTLEDGALMVIHGSIDHAIEEAVTQYVGLQQQTLRDSEERYRLLVAGVHDYALFMLDPDGRVCSWNAGGQRTFGYDAPSITGQPFARFFTAEDVELGAPENHLREAVVQGRHESEGWRRREDGAQFWATSVVTPVHGERGEPRGFSVVTRDITERKYLEDQMLRKADELLAADQRKNEFLAILAHELRTPLGAISNALYLLEQAEVDERTARQLAPIRRQTAHLRRLVDDLLDISRIASGKLPLMRQPVAICEVVSDAAEAVRPLIDTRGHVLAVTVAPGPLHVDGDPTRLVQVVTNLLNNAAKYTDPGGRVWLEAVPEQGQVAIRVRDTGVGIDAALLPRVFDLFAQADPSGARAQGGLGIGLGLVKRLVELHGGTVSARSEGLGRGAEFVVRLPMIAAFEANDSSP
jgi:PAS domain S-box-containing protein